MVIKFDFLLNIYPLVANNLIASRQHNINATTRANIKKDKPSYGQKYQRVCTDLKTTSLAFKLRQVVLNCADIPFPEPIFI